MGLLGATPNPGGLTRSGVVLRWQEEDETVGGGGGDNVPRGPSGSVRPKDRVQNPQSRRGYGSRSLHRQGTLA